MNTLMEKAIKRARGFFVNPRNAAPACGRWTSIRLPEAKEASHQFRMGDTGTGKTSLTYQDLLDAEANGTCCVVSDAKGGEAIARFYNPERGDVILNPTDNRCAYWNIRNEGHDLATYKTVMTSLFPPPVTRNPTAEIFNQWTVSLGAYLLQFPECDTEMLGSWIANYPEIERRVQGTIHQYTLPANSPNQRAGVLGTLALAGDPLWMMPKASEGRREFCIREWTENPKGWVFISSDSNTRDALRPLISMWMDLFILGLLSSRTKRRTKLVYDELHTLQTLTRLHDGITMLRSAGHQIIASIQNEEQLKHLYGDQTRTILSQAYTNGYSPPVIRTLLTSWNASAANASCYGWNKPTAMARRSLSGIAIVLASWRL